MIATLGSMTLLVLLFQAEKGTYDPRFDVDPARKQRFEALDRWKPKSRPPSVPIALDPKAPKLTAVGTLIGFADDVFTLAVDLTPEAKAALVERGTPEVETADLVRDGVIFEERFYRVYSGAPGSSALADRPYLERAVGRRVELELGMTRSGSLRVLSISRI